MSEPFHKRFDIEVTVEEVRRRFVNRIRIGTEAAAKEAPKEDLYLDGFLETICFKLGESPGFINGISGFMRQWDDLVAKDFLKCLAITEAVYYALIIGAKEAARKFDRIIRFALSESEVDLDIAWNGQIFIKKGAQLLDERLINEPLHWLREPKYENVLKPFEKGLKHWMEGNKDPTRYADVITDMYEALEAVAKIVTGRNADLSGNREKFASKLRLPEQYKRMLKEYDSFANEYRHAASPRNARNYPSEPDTEAFMYMTGLFIRLATQQSKRAK
jgi:hypothetical protein